MNTIIHLILRVCNNPMLAFSQKKPIVETILMYYCFLEDKSFYPDKTIDLGTQDTPLAGYLGTNEEAYFYTKATIIDPRTKRLPFLSKDLEGAIKLYFDQSKQDPDDNLFSRINNTELASFFQLLERVYMAVSESQQDLETVLITDRNYAGIYVPGSLKIAKNTVGVTVHQGESTVPMSLPEYFELEVSFTTRYKFKIWLSRAAFLEDYPLFTIIQVVLPCDHTYILNPAKWANAIDALVNSTSFSFPNINKDVSTKDNSGLYAYKTRYVVSSQSTVLLPFGILYKGALPSTMEMRKAIREELLGYGTAPQSKWESLLPDLFVTCEFFLLPIWDNTTVRPDKTLYPSIVPFKKLTGLFQKLFPAYEETFIKDKQEILVVAQSEIFLAAMPSELNEDNQFSILELHPTYQNHTAIDPAFAYQEDKTKEFNKLLNRCLAIAFGEAVSDGAVTDGVIDKRHYFSFVASHAEYHLMAKADYLEFIEE